MSEPRVKLQLTKPAPEKVMWSNHGKMNKDKIP